MTKENIEELTKLMRQLVSDVQGAPFPGGELKNELYEIWYEHAQRAAVECFEYLNDNFPEEQKELDKSINKLFK